MRVTNTNNLNSGKENKKKKRAKGTVHINYKVALSACWPLYTPHVHK